MVGRELPWTLSMATAGTDDGMAGSRASGASFGDIEIEVAVVLQQLRALQAGAFHTRRGRYRPGFEGSSRSRFDGEAIGCQLHHLTSIHVQEAPAVFGD